MAQISNNFLIILSKVKLATGCNWLLVDQRIIEAAKFDSSLQLLCSLAFPTEDGLKKKRKETVLQFMVIFFKGLREICFFSGFSWCRFSLQENVY